MYSTNFIPQGWECPKCKRVYSPTTTMCAQCPIQTSTGTSIGIAGLGTTSSTSFTHEFESDKKSSSKTKCKICGKQKWEHPNISYT